MPLTCKAMFLGSCRRGNPHKLLLDKETFPNSRWKAIGSVTHLLWVLLIMELGLPPEMVVRENWSCSSLDLARLPVLQNVRRGSQGTLSSSRTISSSTTSWVILSTQIRCHLSSRRGRFKRMKYKVRRSHLKTFWRTPASTRRPNSKTETFFWSNIILI